MLFVTPMGNSYCLPLEAWYKGFRLTAWLGFRSSCRCDMQGQVVLDGKLPGGEDMNIRSCVQR